MEFITLDKRAEDRVCVMTMNYKKENRFNPVFLAELHAALDDCEKDDNVGALVVTGGDPKFWSNGLDLEHIMMNIGDNSAIVGYLKSVNDIFKRWCLYPKPTVAALNGHTFAAGLFTAGYFDFRIMREDRGWICLPEVDINIPLLPGMIAICQATMTAAGFKKLYYSGARLTGPEAKEIGFVDEVASEEKLLPLSIEVAAGLAKKKTRTYCEMKRRIREPIADILDNEDPKYFMDTLKFSMPS